MKIIERKSIIYYIRNYVELISKKDNCILLNDHLFDKYVLDSDSISDEDKHYVIAMIIRGGVFNKKTKND